MSYGLRIKNVNAEIQIDESYRNLAQHQIGSNTIINDNTAGGYYTTIAITASPLVPVILFQPGTDYFSNVFSYRKTGNNFDGFYATTIPTQSTVINWMVYRQTPSKSVEQYGLRTYDASSNLIYDSGEKYFKIYAVESISLANADPDNPPYQDIVHSGISNPYYLLSPASAWYIGYYAPPTTRLYRFQVGLKKLSATSVRIGWFVTLFAIIPAEVPAAYGNLGYNPIYKLIICDVTT